MAIALAQTVINGVAFSGFTASATFGSNTTTGNTIIAVCSLYGNTTLTSLSIAINHGTASFSKIIEVAGSSFVAGISIWAAPNIVGGTTPIVTATADVAIVSSDVFLYELSGMPTSTTQDGTAASSSSTTSNSMVAPSITTTGSNTIIFTVFGPFGTGAAGEAGWQSKVGTATTTISQYIIETSPQTGLIATATQTGGTGGAYSSIVAGFAGTTSGSVPSVSINPRIYIP